MGATPLSLFRKLPISIPIFFIVLMLILGAEYVYGVYASQMKDVLYVYLLMFLLASVMIGWKKSDQMETVPTWQGITQFGIMAVATYVVMIFLPVELLKSTMVESAISMAAIFTLSTAFVKAWIEEKIFRDKLPKVLGGTNTADIISSVLFGFFHLFVLAGVLGFSMGLFYPMVFLMILGYIWALVRRRFGILGSTGSHFMYNVVVLGLI